MGVDLGGFKARVAEQLLNESKVYSTVKEMGGERMSQRMGMYGSCKPSVQNPSNITRTKRPTTTIEKNRIAGRRLRHEEGKPLRQPLFKCLNHAIMERKDSLLRSLTEHPNSSIDEIETSSCHSTEFTDTKSTPIEQLHDSEISSNTRDLKSLAV